jgi:DNA-binding TFAR19-related protein (PDSD5 family)
VTKRHCSLALSKAALDVYFRLMTKLLEQALEAVRRLPPDAQDEIARAMLSLAGDEREPEPIDPAHLSDVLESLAEARRREFATDAEVEAAFRRFNR